MHDGEATEREQAFQSELGEKAIGDARRAALVAAMIYPLFLFIDLTVYPQLLEPFLILRSAVVAGNLMIVALMRLHYFQDRALNVGMAIYLLTAVPIAIMTHVAGGAGSPYYAGINLVLVGLLVIMPLDVLRTAVVCGVVYATYVIPIIFTGAIGDVPILLNNNAFLLSTMVLVTLSAYYSRGIRRSEFNSRYQLAHANEELRKMDVLKSQFFANISHEIRTPLTSIMAPVKSLHNGDAGALNQHQAELVSQAYRNSIRLLDMVNQMLDFAKFDARKMQLRLKMVHIESVVREHVSLFREVCQRKGLTIGYRISGPVPSVYLDVDKLERILSNLIRNAIKFTDSGSIQVEAAAGDRSIILRVRDTGIGIARNQLPRIFERFQQVDASSTRKYEGTGLGLTIVKEAVELQHGSIAVQSAEGAGTTFTVTLPTDLDMLEPDSLTDRRRVERRREDVPFEGPDRRVTARRREDSPGISLQDIVFLESATLDQATSEDDAPEVADPGADALTVLYVEDNADLRNYVRRTLAGLGFRVISAVDGYDGVQKATQDLPDIVVSDVMMPRMDGFELVRTLKTDDVTREIPVILITAKSEIDAKIAGLDIGADDYLAKPIDMRELDARIRNLVTLRRFREAAARTRELESRIEELSFGFSRALELRDRYTAGHSNDVLSYGTMIAESAGLPVTRDLREALLLHDIGKIGVPDHILLKPSGLDESEWQIMRTHPDLGADLLKQFPSFSRVAEIIAAHHERFDGTGYPRGLAGNEIPIEARIVALADAWHAMREDRAYRSAIPVNVAAREILRNRGRQFDPDLADAFVGGLVARGELSALEVERATADVGKRS